MAAIEFHTFATSNAQRVAIMLEECALAYQARIVDLTKGAQREPAYLALNPAGAVPTIVDPEGPGGTRLVLSQSGAILLYLAEKTGRFLPHDPVRRAMAYQWLMFATTDCASSTTTIFYMSSRVPDRSPANAAFFEERLTRQFGVANERLRGREWLADELSIADFALYPIYASRRTLAEKAGNLTDLARWAATLEARPGVARAMKPLT